MHTSHSLNKSPTYLLYPLTFCFSIAFIFSFFSFTLDMFFFYIVPYMQHIHVRKRRTYGVNGMNRNERRGKNVYKKPTTALMAMGARNCTEKGPQGEGELQRERKKTSSLHDKNSNHNEAAKLKQKPREQKSTEWEQEKIKFGESFYL